MLYSPSLVSQEGGSKGCAARLVVGLATLGRLVSFCTLLHQYQPFLYQGGLALVAITTAAVIAVTVHPHARLGTGLLGRWPLRLIDLRSHGIYLWHWQIGRASCR